MVSADIKVKCSGAVLSYLLYEQLRCCHMQEGFILGQVDSHIREHISDSQICNEETETTINLTGVLPCTTLGSFYSGAGRVNEDKLKAYLGSNFKNVIGWYRCRGSNCDDMYLRESRVHHQLDEMMTHAGGNFIMTLLSYTPCGTSGTLALSHKFLVLRNRCFESVALEVVNMNDTSTSEYIMEVNNHSIYSSTAVKDVLSSLKTPEPGVSEAVSLHKGLLSKLQDLLPTYSTTQETHHQILEEVIQLRSLCYSNGITPDFIPSNVEETNLVSLEDGPNDSTQSSLPARGKKSKSKSPSRTSGKKRVSSRNRESSETKNSSDPFGFVNTEMEKLQVKTKPNTKKLGKSFSDVALQPDTEKNHSPSLRGSPRKNSANTRSTSAHVESESPPSSPSRLRSKSARPGTDSSRHSQSPSRTRTRNATPSKVKSKVKEAWTRKSSESQEY